MTLMCGVASVALYQSQGFPPKRVGKRYNATHATHLYRDVSKVSRGGVRSVALYQTGSVSPKGSQVSNDLTLLTPTFHSVIHSTFEGVSYV